MSSDLSGDILLAIETDMTPTPRRRGPGRPESEGHQRRLILSVAQDLFAQNGYAGTSFKMIASASGITPALLTYYFGTKEALHEEIYLSAASQIGAARLKNLENLGPEPQDISALLDGFILPVIEMASTLEGAAFLRFQWRVDSEPLEISLRLRQSAYDNSTRAYVTALLNAGAARDESDCLYRLACIIGASNYAISARHRMDVLLPNTSVEGGTLGILETLRRTAYTFFTAP